MGEPAPISRFPYMHITDNSFYIKKTPTESGRCRSLFAGHHALRPQQYLPSGDATVLLCYWHAPMLGIFLQKYILGRQALRVFMLEIIEIPGARPSIALMRGTCQSLESIECILPKSPLSANAATRATVDCFQRTSSSAAGRPGHAESYKFALHHTCYGRPQSRFISRPRPSALYEEYGIREPASAAPAATRTESIIFAGSPSRIFMLFVCHIP